MFGLGVQELLLILVIILIFFGAEKIPQLAKALGKGMSEFRKAQNNVKEELNSAGETPVATVICQACQGRTLAGSLYCSQCGHPLNDFPKCSACQQTLQPDDKFCPKCGEPRQ